MSDVKYPTSAEVSERAGAVNADRDNIIRAAIDLYREQSEQPEPVDSIPWKLRSWAEWAAKDEDGVISFHEDKPTARMVFWSSPGRQTVTRQAVIPGHWRASLRKRPDAV